MDSSTGAPSLVVIPTYNEAENIESVVARALAASPEIDVLIVDDSSPDGTGVIADRLAAASSRVFALHRAGKDGLGRAYIEGFAWARDRGYARVAEMDADGSHQPESLPDLFALLDSYDLAIGSRWVAGGRTENWPLLRQIISRGGSAYARAALGVSIRDVTSGFRAFRMATLDAISLDTVESSGYCFQIDLLWRSIQSDMRVAEYPIRFIERVNGTSKMSRRIVVEAMLKVTRWGLGRWFAALREFEPAVETRESVRLAR